MPDNHDIFDEFDWEELLRITSKPKPERKSEPEQSEPPQEEPQHGEEPAPPAEPEQKHSEQKPSAEKTPEVCKVAEAQPAVKPAEGEKAVKKETAEAVETTVSARDAEPPEAAEVLPFKAEPPADAQDSGAADFVPKKYFSRDCSVDKKGNRYTLEELEEQIK